MWNPEDYAKNSDTQLQWARELRQNIALQGHESILDVGCGDGKITADFARTMPQSRVVGIDSSEAMVEYARRTYPPAQYPNLSFELVDARALTYQEEFDLCFSNATLHWVDDHRSFLAGASRALRPGGQLAISCGGHGNAADILPIFTDLMAQPTWATYFADFQNPYYFYGENDYTPWVEECNFKIESLKMLPKDMVHQGREGLASWIRTTWMPFTNCVPVEQRDEFINLFVDRYLELVPLDQYGLAHVAMVRLEAKLLKTPSI
jgi:trans-aconitate 2-methyltransferase